MGREGGQPFASPELSLASAHPSTGSRAAPGGRARRPRADLDHFWTAEGAGRPIVAGVQLLPVAAGSADTRCPGGARPINVSLCEARGAQNQKQCSAYQRQRTSRTSALSEPAQRFHPFCDYGERQARLVWIGSRPSPRQCLALSGPDRHARCLRSLARVLAGARLCPAGSGWTSCHACARSDHATSDKLRSGSCGHAGCPAGVTIMNWREVFIPTRATINVSPSRCSTATGS